MVWMLLAIPLSSVCVGGVMLWLAIHNEDGLVVDDYYKRGLQINRTLERDAVAARYALSSDLRFVGATGQIVATVESDLIMPSNPGSTKKSSYHESATRHMRVPLPS